MSDPDISEAVVLFKSRDIQRRMAAVDMAVSLRSREALALLIKALQDQSWSLREYAITRMAALGPAGVGPLVQLLRNGVWFARAAAARALGMIGDIRALEPLLSLVDDGNHSVAGAARGAAAAVCSAAGPEALAGLADRVPLQRRREMAAQLAPIDGAAARALTASLSPDGAAAPAEERGAQRDAAEAEALQALRRQFKSGLARDDRGDDELA
jgi:HEAT repeat protein